jgi:hypothetical protein
MSNLVTSPNFRFGSRLCENPDVELARRRFVSITLNKERTSLTVTVEREKERKQFYAFSARARFHTAWVIFGLGAHYCDVRFTPMSRHRQFERSRLKVPIPQVGRCQPPCFVDRSPGMGPGVRRGDDVD